MKKIGFIGCGNIARAMIRQMIKKKVCDSENIIASALHWDTLEKTHRELGISVAQDNRQVVREADIIFLAVKPQEYRDVITEIRYEIDRQLIVTIAAGKTLKWVKETFERDVKLVRTMPNTPVMVGEGVTGACKNSFVTPDEFDEVMKILATFGQAIEVKEAVMDVVGSIGGSAPALVYMFIEAMADAAVADGMHRDLAYRFATQSVLGSAKMVRDSGLHPGVLKDQVCSPGGIAIEAVQTLERHNYRSAVIEAVRACTEKSKNLF